MIDTAKSINETFFAEAAGMGFEPAFSCAQGKDGDHCAMGLPDVILICKACISVCSKNHQ